MAVDRVRVRLITQCGLEVRVHREVRLQVSLTVDIFWLRAIGAVDPIAGHRLR